MKIKHVIAQYYCVHVSSGTVNKYLDAYESRYLCVITKDDFGL